MEVYCTHTPLLIHPLHCTNAASTNTSSSSTKRSTQHTSNLPANLPLTVREAHNHHNHNTTSPATFDGAVADAIDTLKDEMPGGELALIVCLVAGACFILGAFAMWLILRRRRRRGWTRCRRCRNKRRKRKIGEEGRVWLGMEKCGWMEGSEERMGRRRGWGRDSAAEEGAEEEMRAEECLGGIY